MRPKSFCTKLIFICSLFAFLLDAKGSWGQDFEWRRKRRTNNTIETKPQPATVSPQTAPVHTPQAAQLQGSVTDEEGNPLPGAFVRIKDGITGTITNENGHFQFEKVGQNEFTLVVEFVGFEPQEINLSLPVAAPLNVKLSEKSIVTKEIVVTASRRSEQAFVSPVTTYKMTVLDIRESPSTNVYQMASAQPGVQVINSSFMLSSVNIRGLGQTMNSRVLTLVDGVDAQSPSLGVTLGTLNVIPELDVAATEIVAGPASALYGPNAFNGVYNIIAKDAFQYPGLSVTVKPGLMHLDSKDGNLQPVLEAGVRYAVVFKQKFALKANLTYLQADDWHASDFRDVSDYRSGKGSAVTERGPDNPGYNGVNLYGDETDGYLDGRNSAPPDLPGGPLVKTDLKVNRTGYRETDLASYYTRNLKADLTGQWRLDRRHEIVVGGRYTQGEGMIQPLLNARVRLRDVKNYTFRFELIKPELQPQGLRQRRRPPAYQQPAIRRRFANGYSQSDARMATAVCGRL